MTMIFRKIILYILCWYLCVTLTAQSSVVDSLEQVLVSGKLNDLEKIELLKDLYFDHMYVDSSKRRMYVMEMLKLAQSIGSKKEEAYAYFMLAGYHNGRGDTAKMRTSIMEMLRIAQNNKGLEAEKGLAYIQLGRYYMAINQYYSAHVQLKKAEKLFVKVNDKDRLYPIYRDLSTLFGMIKDRDNVLYYTNKQIEIAVALNDPVKMQQSQNDLGWDLYEDNLGQDEVLDYFLDMYQKAILLNSDRYISINAAICGQIYIQHNRPREALKYLNQAKDYIEAGGRGLMISIVYQYIAEAYVMLHQTDSAEYYMKKAHDSPVMREDTKLALYRLRSEIEAIKGNYRGALEAHKKYHHLSDSITKSQKTTEIARMRNWHELEQKDHENEILQQEHQKQQKLILILAVALIMIIALFAISIFFYRKSANKNRELKELHRVKDKLFSVVAHDLRHPISTLVSLLRLAEANMLDVDMQAQFFKDISNQVDDTFGLLDNLLCWSKSQMQGIVPAREYFDVKMASLEVTNTLQNVAANKNIALTNHIEQQQVYADCDMFALVVRNLTMNAIKYTSEGGEVTLASELSDDLLIISVKDTGIGMSQEIQNNLFKLSETRSRYGTNNESGAGLGLVLCYDFVKANGGSIWFKSKQDKGSTFFFTLPINAI